MKVNNKSRTRQWPAIDLFKLFISSNNDKWNAWLASCLLKRDIEELKKTRYGIQAGMDDLVKKKMNTSKIVDLFIRMNRSIELTVKSIYREKFPCKLDNPDAAKTLSIHQLSIERSKKKKRDQEFEKFLKESSF